MTQHKKRTSLIALAGLAATSLLLGSPMAEAQTWPSRPISIIVPYGPGTGSDVVVRLLTAPLSERLKQSVIVENKAGAGGAVGVKALKDAKPDGYTLGALVSANAIQPYVMKNVPFDVRTDFMPITLLYSGPLSMIVPPTIPVKTVADFVTWAKANRGKVNFGSVGAGSTSHLVSELLMLSAGIEMTHVPYKGSADVYTGMLSGGVHVMFDNYLTPKPLVEAGRLNVVAVTSEKRVPWLPNVPTMSETYPGSDASFWVGLAGPLGMPAAIHTRLANEIRAVIATADFQKRLLDQGLIAGGSSPADFGKFINSEYVKWGKITAAAGLKPQ